MLEEQVITVPFVESYLKYYDKLKTEVLQDIAKQKRNSDSYAALKDTFIQQSKALGTHLTLKLSEATEKHNKIEKIYKNNQGSNMHYNKLRVKTLLEARISQFKSYFFTNIVF